MRPLLSPVADGGMTAVDSHVLVLLYERIENFEVDVKVLPFIANLDIFDTSAIRRNIVVVLVLLGHKTGAGVDHLDFIRLVLEHRRVCLSCGLL